MTLRTHTAAAALAALALIASPRLEARAASASAQDTMFVTQAAQGGMAEVQDAKVAQSHGSSTAVKAYATKMIADHTAADAKLMALAKKNGYTVPASIGAQNQQTKEMIGQLTGTKFDAAYLHAQVTGHEKMEMLMQKEISSGTDSDLVAFAKTTLPTVKEHLAMAKSDLSGSAMSQTGSM